MLALMKVNLLQGTCTPTLTPMPGVHQTACSRLADARGWCGLVGHSGWGVRKQI